MVLSLHSKCYITPYIGLLYHTGTLHCCYTLKIRRLLKRETTEQDLLQDTVRKADYVSLVMFNARKTAEQIKRHYIRYSIEEDHHLEKYGLERY